MKLIHHKSSETKNYNVEINYKIKNNTFILDAIATTTLNKWNTNSKFLKNSIENWGLWEHDVIEVFLQERNEKYEINAPYLENQLSPLGQKFALKIKKPRVDFHTPKNYNLLGLSTLKNNEWNAHIEIPLKKNKIIFGNIFAILGPEDSREYLALNPNLEETPDHHRPDLFLGLN